MPYASRAQQGLFHSPNSPVSKEKVAEFDAASKGQHGMPYHVSGSSREPFSKLKKAMRKKPNG